MHRKQIIISCRLKYYYGVVTIYIDELGRQTLRQSAFNTFCGLKLLLLKIITVAFGLNTYYQI